MYNMYIYSSSVLCVRTSVSTLTRCVPVRSSCALCNVCANHEANKRQAREVGALPVLVHLLSTSQVLYVYMYLFLSLSLHTYII